jgi:threonylcarbamoyladenosine tRNA methylthiotransferase MtaB
MSGPIDVVTFGCRLNIAESAAIRALAAAHARSPIVVVNTCAVTRAAERDARRAIRRLRRERPDAAIVVTGCAAQRDPALFAAMPEVARVVGNAEKLEAATWHAHDARRVQVGDIMTARRAPDLPLDAAPEGTRAIVEIQHGCDHRCTFCAIPYARGPSRSQPLGAVVQRVAALVARSSREIVLSGVDLASYGRDLPGAPTLGAAVRRILRAVPELPRLRLSSLDPGAIDDTLIAAYAEESRLMPHAHLSLQSGDDLILKRMKRRHSRADALRLVARMARARPAIAFGADLIAGFPTEDDAAFERSRALIDELGLAFVHVFGFDPRPGTPGARMPQLPAATIRSRAAALRAHASMRRTRALRERIGATISVLVERGGRSGHAEDFTAVTLTAEAAPGSILAARVIDASDGRLVAGRI